MHPPTICLLHLTHQPAYSLFLFTHFIPIDHRSPYSHHNISSPFIEPAVFSIGRLHIILQYSILGCCIIPTPSQMSICLVCNGRKEQHVLISTRLTITEAMENERGPEPRCVPLCAMVQINFTYISLHQGYCCSNVAFLC